jgi:hypothetical protein
MSDNKFIPGLYVNPPHPNQKSFVKGRIGMKRVELINWLQEQRGEYVNVDILESKKDKDKWYAQINDYKGRDSASGAASFPRQTFTAPARSSESSAEFIDDDIPF